MKEKTERLHSQWSQSDLFSHLNAAGGKVSAPPAVLRADGHSSFSLVINYFTAHLVDKWLLIYKQDSGDGRQFFVEMKHMRVENNFSDIQFLIIRLDFFFKFQLVFFFF